VERQATNTSDRKAIATKESNSLLLRLLDAITASKTDNELLSTSLSIMQEAMRSEIAWLGTVDDDGNLRGLCLLSGAEPTWFHEHPEGLWADSLDCREPTVINNQDDCPEPLGLDSDTIKLRSLVIVPFCGGHPVRGFMAFANSPGGYDEATVDEIVIPVRMIEACLTQKRLEEELREREARFRLIADSARDGIVVIDSAGEVTYWNKAAEKMFGYTADEMLGQELHMVITPKHLHTAYLEGFERFQQGGTGPAVGKTLELPAIRKDGSEFTVELSLSAVSAHDGWHAIGVVRDITQRKEAQAVLRESEQRFRAIFEDSADGIVIGDLETHRFTMVNNKIRQMLGYQDDEMENLTIEDIWADRRREQITEIFEKLKSEKTQAINDCEVRCKDGRTFQADVVFSFLSLSGRSHFMAIIRDITERKALEYQLAQVQKLQSIGQLAAGIAHEINTPMQYIGDNTLFLKDAFSDISRVLEAIRNHTSDGGGESSGPAALPSSITEGIDIDFIVEEIPKAIDQILEGVKRVTQIVKAMKDFSHPDDTVPTPFDVNKAIESTVTIARNEWKYVADCELDLEPSLPPVLGFQGEFNQAILNMVVNAAHAIAEVVGDGSGRKGKITITSRRVGNWVEVRISDTGCGIPPEIRNRIFDPFFTTKEVGKGTGQGLTIAHSVIVKKHKGTLSFESEVGKGTTFIIRLPIRRAESEGA